MILDHRERARADRGARHRQADEAGARRHRRRPRATSSSTAAPPTRCTARRSRSSTATPSTSLREPLGVTGHIIPWNYPAQMFGRTLGAALAMGNAVGAQAGRRRLPSPLRLAELAAEAGFPRRRAQHRHRPAARKPARRSPRIPASTSSPSPARPRSARWSSRRRRATTSRCTLELGGKSPQIVFADADLDAALPVIVNAIVQNAGQTCSAGSRAAGRAQRLRRFVGASPTLRQRCASARRTWTSTAAR